MKHLSIILTTLLCALGMMAQENRYALKVNDFSELRVTGDINVDYRCSADSAGMVVFTSTAQVAPRLLFDANGKKLTIQLSDETVSHRGLPTVTVYSTYLTKVLNSGDSTVRVLSVAGGPQFEATQEGNGRLAVRNVEATQVKASLKTGNGSVVIAGKCQKANISLAGTGTIDADGLKAREAKVTAFGTGQIGVCASEKLSVFGTGSTTIYYKGKPEVKNRTAGIKLIEMLN